MTGVQTCALPILLRRIAAQNKGRFVTTSSMNQLADAIIASSPKNILHTNEEIVELISIPWLFFLFIALASTEWFMRKYKGGY